MKKNISIGLLGLGVVGSGVVHIINQHQEELVHKLGCHIDVKGILVRNLDKARQVDVDPDVLTTDAEDILETPEIDIVVEVMGGIEPARKYILQALANKKHVVTANKDLIALHGPELHDVAKENGCDLYYEASVAGGIPIIRGLTEGLAADRIHQVMGIVNGTTNYILTKMDIEGASYEAALKEAQDLGFAEADPTADVEGLDAARKMVILARLAFLTDISLDDVEVEGISNVSSTDIKYGKQLGYKMKLIGYASRDGEQVEISVRPTFLSEKHPLAGVVNEYNAVYVNGDAVGQTMFYGPGAGSLPTATAIMSDVVATIKNIQLGTTGHTAIEPLFTKTLTTPEQQRSKFYLRLHVKDEVGAFATVSELFNEQKISFEKIIQTPSEDKSVAEIVVTTHETSLATFKEALVKLDALDVVESIQSYYRIEGDA